MPLARRNKLTTFKGCGWTALARLQLPSGVDISQVEIAAVNVVVCDSAGSVTFKASSTDESPAITVISTVFDTLQTDARWDIDSYGYNFAYEVPAGAFSFVGGATCCFTFTPASGEVFALDYIGTVISRPGVS